MPSTNPAQSQLLPLAIYIHWPFCKKKCPYCDFNSHVREAVDHAAHREALRAELRYHHGISAPHCVSSIFFGGGTPSLMHPETAQTLIDDVQRLWPVRDDLEITLEANPTSVEAEKFADLARAGVNRFSLGIQSLHDDALQFLGREHSAHEALRAIETAAKHAPRYSFDLIYALPDQTEQAWETQLREALALGAQHMSLYQLTIEENTAFHHAYHADKAFALPDDARAARLYDLTGNIMQSAGMPAYEISNYAAIGHASRHNLAYWRSQAYLGIGAGAHGRVDTPDARLATQNIKSPERWLSSVQRHGHGLESSVPLSARERLEERLIMGLRLVEEGLLLDEATYEMLRSKIEMLQGYGLLICEHLRLRVTAKGALVLNAVVAALASALTAAAC